MSMECRENILEGCSVLISKRYILMYVAFFGFFWTYAMRFNLSMAIVCMVRTPPPSQLNLTSFNATEATIHDLECHSEVRRNSSEIVTREGEFDWDRSTQGLMLSSFFWGYIITQFPAGFLADKKGTKLVFGVGIMVAAIATTLIPVAARGNEYAVIFLRFVVGLGTGVTFPSMHGLWAKWAPTFERSKLVTYSHMGAIVGNVVIYFTSGVLCEYGFDGGWPSVFYVTGCGSLIWCFFWFFLVYDAPEKHPTISEAEKEYILSNTSRDNPHVSKKNVPWGKVFKSLPVWSTFVSHPCNNWGGYTIMVCIPIYMKDVLNFDMKQNGIYSALPYIGMAINGILSAKLADYIRKRGVSTTYVRKTFQSLGMIMPAIFLVGVGYLNCTQRTLAVTFLVFAVTTNSFIRAGFTVNQVDIAPRYAGSLLGISNTLATIPGFLAPVVVGQLTGDKSRGSWQIVFFICAGFYMFGFIFFAIFASGEEQDWAKADFSDKELADELDALALVDKSANNPPMT